MCGIGGWIGAPLASGTARQVAQDMAGTLACRGPDDEGFWYDDDATLVHRRLSVVDPAGGAQPMVIHHGGATYAITYNGELYNADELMRDLRQLGHAFRTRSDTEVLLRAYTEWKERCLERLNGIFAFAVWTVPGRELFLARDRLGVKPLFVAWRKKGLVFGSELKTLLAHPAVEPRLDDEGLAELFVMAPARTPGHGVFQGVEELLPGTWLRVNQNGVRHRKYWRLQNRDHVDSPEKTAETVRDLLSDAVCRQLVADVPVATFLSGGLDSSGVSAIASREFAAVGRGPLHTYSLDFDGMDRHFHPTPFQADLDGPWALRVARHLGTVHHRVVLDTPELVAHLTTSLRARDFPGMADIDTSLYLLCREIRQDATVALSGEAADEVFGGYPWLFHTEALASETFPWARRLPDRVRLLSPALIDRIRPAAYVERRYREALEELDPWPGEDALHRRIREVSYLNLTRFLSNLLDRKDRMSMAVGLEVRVPFCDHRLVEYAWNIPWEMKAKDGVAKAILRNALKGLLPDDVLKRVKRPYPSTMNPTYTQALRTWLIRILDDPSSPLIPWVDVGAIRQLTSAGLAAPELPWFGQLMGLPHFFAYLIQVDTWLRDYHVQVA